VNAIKVCARYSGMKQDEDDYCIICFEDANDASGSPPVDCRKLVNQPSCACEYLVHPDCLDRWIDTLGARGPPRCLVCRSVVERRRPLGEVVTEFFEARDEALTRGCTLCCKGMFYASACIMVYVLVASHA
jgi:hypothetical protein